MLNHQNNFSTNLTSNQSAGVTTTPLNSIPSVAAPFKIALDATNINGKYEVVRVTSKTSTNILHAATTYAHTTEEEVRMVVDAGEMDKPENGLWDENQNEVVKVAATASAVNEITVANAATGGVPTISATGDDTNIHLALTPKGNGLVKTSVLRQNDTTNNYKPNSVVLCGYGSVVGNGVNTVTAAETITFGVTFENDPIIIIQGAGAWGGTPSGDNWHSSANTVNGMVPIISSVSTTACVFNLQDVNGLTTDAGKNYLYTWIAIGVLV